MLKIFIGVLLIVHGIAHLIGFLVPWKLATFEETPYKTTLFGGKIDVGAIGIRLMGILWFVTAVIFIISGIGVIGITTWWWSLTLLISLISLLLCILGWPDSKIGILVNLLLIIFLFIIGKSGAIG